MFQLNQKGQAFSVFKLLIAAIVAVFILTFLLQILSNINPPTQGDPNIEASSKIKSLLTKLGTAERTSVVTFGPGNTMRARTIAEGTGALGRENVCLMIGENENTETFGAADGATIVYNGNSTIQRKLYILCDLEKEISLTIDELSAAGVALIDEAFVNGQPNNCITPSGTNSSNKYCIVSVISTGT